MSKKLFYTIIFILILTSLATCNKTDTDEQKNAGDPDQLELVWGDEFDYTGLPDPSKWIAQEMRPGTVNEELQNYTFRRPENARVENSMLIIEARRDNNKGYPYSSAGFSLLEGAYFATVALKCARNCLQVSVHGRPYGWFRPVRSMVFGPIMGK